MKKYTKIFLILTAVFSILGLGMIIAGLSMGATWAGVKALDDENFAGWIQEIEEKTSAWHGDKDWEEEFENLKESGDTAALSGYEDGDDQIYTLDAAKVKSMALNISNDSLKLKESSGDEIQVHVEEDPEQKVQVSVSGSTLLVEDKKMLSWDREITIYYPKDLKLEKLDMNLGAGEIQIDGDIYAESIQASIGTGELDGEGKIVCSSSTWNVGAGDISLYTLDCPDIVLNCGVGDLDVEVTGREKDYNYEMSCGLGEIEIGDQSYSGAFKNRKVDNGAKRSVKADCGIGDLSITFHD